MRERSLSVEFPRPWISFGIPFGWAAFLWAAAAQGAEFMLGFEGLPGVVQGSPGEVLTLEAYATLTTTSNETPDGPQAWAFAIGAEGGVITGISLDGVKVSTIYDEDHDRDPATPAIHHDPYEKDLGTLRTTGGFSVAMVCRAKRGEEELGRYAGTAVVLHQFEKMVLQPMGTERLARITVQTTAPAHEGCAPLSLFYVSEGGWICLDESARAVSCATGGNVITFAGMSSYATEGASPLVQVCVTSFRRGDSNADGRVDISDAIFTLSFLYLGGAATPCLDAADANDDGGVDISDGILILDRLFIAGPAAVIRPPGIHSCGPDPRSDGLGCASYTSCV